jgi:hypothetical protein
MQLLRNESWQPSVHLAFGNVFDGSGRSVSTGLERSHFHRPEGKRLTMIWSLAHSTSCTAPAAVRSGSFAESQITPSA